MARLILSNSNKYFEKCKKVYENQNFKKYAEFITDEVCIATFSKKRVSIDNFTIINGNDFCASNGTYIYNNMIGKSALNAIYKDFDGDITKVRLKTLGNYILVIKKNDNIKVFVDKYQILSLYYYINTVTKEWIITNSLDAIGKAVDDLTIDEITLMQDSFTVGSFGRDTVFHEIKRLCGIDLLEIDCLNATIDLKIIPYKRNKRDLSSKNINEIVTEYAEMVKSKFLIVSEMWGDDIRIHQTGGLDNRTVFSAFMSVGCKPNIMYGIGNSKITNTRFEDYQICKMYATKFDINLYELDWKENYVDNTNDWTDLFKKYGFNYTIYGGNRSYFKEYESRIQNYPKFTENGYFLENLRLREWIYEKSDACLSLDEFTEKYLLGSAYGNSFINKEFYKNFETLKKKTISKLEYFATTYGIEKKITKQNFDELRWIDSSISDSQVVNLLNDFGPSIAIFSTPELFEYPFDIPHEYRANGKFQMMLIHNLCPETTSVPIFSHCKSHKLDTNDYSLKTIYSFKYMIRNTLKNVGLNESQLKKIAKIYRNIINKESKNVDTEIEILREILIEKINHLNNELNLSNPVIPENFYGSIDYLLRHAQMLYGINLILKNK